LAAEIDPQDEPVRSGQRRGSNSGAGSASAIARHFGLPHESVWAGATGVPRGNPISSQLLQHLFVTEGEMSPIDLTSRMVPRSVFQLSGQESGLRNIAGNRDVQTREALERWLMATIGQGDICGVLTDAARDANIADARAYLDRVEAAGVPYEQTPTKHRVDYRGSRWVSRVWGANNAVGFSPQIFRSEVVTLATYNSGARSRRLEEFHFEMLRRIDPALVDLPFAGQSWEAELLEMAGHASNASEPLTWPEGSTPFSQRPMFGALRDNFDAFSGFVAEYAGPTLRSVVDIDKLLAFDPESLKPGHVQPLWQIFQCAMLDATSDFAQLRTQDWESFGVPSFRQAA
jgi:hypothetical protein